MTLPERYWQFRKIAAVEEPVFNGVLEKFYNMGIDGLVRENIQNSLDAKLPGCPLPVEVRIETGEIDTEKIPGIHEIRRRIQVLKGENSYTRDTIDLMKTNMVKSPTPYISFEDRNTKGLTGASQGENYGPEDTWGVYAYKKGVHYFENNRSLENLRGGSHGVGKIASNAASGLYMMYFANCDQEGRQHLGGTVQLIEHIFQGQNYRATGYFSDMDENGVLYPYKNEFDPVFKKDTRGLKIIIPFLRNQFCDKKQILRSICDNFFVAILSGKLVVYQNGLKIDRETILQIVNDRDNYPEQEESEFRDNFTPLYIRTFREEKPSAIVITDKRRAEHRFLLYLRYSGEIKRGRIAIVRRIGMKIEDKKIRNYANSPFNGVLIPESEAEDMFLKTMENESHSEISDKHLKDPEEQKNALRFINNISKRIGELMSEILKKNNPSDGKIDTSDLLYSVETSFRKDLEKQISTVKLTRRNKDSQRTLVKVKTHSRTNTRQNAVKNQQTQNRQRAGRARKRDGHGDPQNRVRYSMNPESIQRLVLKDKEILQLDFSGNKQYDGEKTCDVSLAVIDGAGREYDTELNVEQSYPEIRDKNTGKPCKVINNMIKDVVIQNNQIHLEMKMSDQFNRSLKFVYYVEV